MTKITMRSPAKLNWYLRVFEPRADGYHDIETIFQELELADELSFERGEDESCLIAGFPADVPAEANLITRAWQLLREAYPGHVHGIRVNAVKNLPRGGGLGGGSSNAAAALTAISQLFGLNLPFSRLKMLGSRLGSDVPFFIRGGCAIGRGRGEQIEPVEGAGEFPLVLVFPDMGVSTRDAYARLDSLKRPQTTGTNVNSLLNAIRSGDPGALAPLIRNDFELVVKDEPWYRHAFDILMSQGCQRVFLCGSGSTVAGLTRTMNEADKIKSQVREFCNYTSLCTRALSG